MKYIDFFNTFLQILLEYYVIEEQKFHYCAGLPLPLAILVNTPGLRQPAMHDNSSCCVVDNL